MNKIIPFSIFVILIFSSLGVGAIYNDTSETKILTKSIIFLKQPIFEKKDNYLRITYDGATSKLMIPGEPELPIYVTTFILPKESRNIRVLCNIKETGMMKISDEIIPVSVYPLNLQDEFEKLLEKNEQLYLSNELYPSNWYSYDIGRGLDDEDPVIFVKIVCNVVRYAPALDIVEYMKEADITITYEYTCSTSSKPNIYDMVIISPKKFAAAFQPLIDHKNSLGINTTLKTVEEILVNYNGFDAPEKIKYFIKDAIEQWGITYVLLGGGLKSYLFAKDREDCNQGTKAWHVPVRYTNIILRGRDQGCISDLYYADIYDENGTFSSWDSNGDGIFAAWNKDDVLDDDFDLYPDVYVARLPCRNKQEVKLMVNKTIVYESTNPASKRWFKKMIAIAGLTLKLYDGTPDGEYICDRSIYYMHDLVKEPIRVYISNNKTGGLIPTSNDIIQALEDGAGFVLFQGHGSPFSWNTLWEDGEKWVGGLELSNFWHLNNLNNLPVVVVGGCHCGLFNVTVEKTIRSGNRLIKSILDWWIFNYINLPFLQRFLERFLLPLNYYWTYGVPTPVCFSWGLCLVPWGGAIASTGCTGLGFGFPGNPVSWSSELDLNFFYEIGQRAVSNLGCAYGGAATKYLNENFINDIIDIHCITVYELFGDPSLKFGGYE